MRTVTKGVSLAQLGWTVHVASGTYATGEVFPISIPNGVTVTGDASSNPVLTTLIVSNAPSQLVVMNNPGATFQYFEIWSSGTINSQQSLVTMKGDDALLSDCYLQCLATHCTAVSLSGENFVSVENNYIDTALDDNRGIDAQMGTNGIAVLDNNYLTGTLSSGGTQIGNPSLGVVAAGGEVRLSNGMVANFSTGVLANNDAMLNMRNVYVFDNALFGIRVNVSNIGSVDLGTTSSPGLNTIQSMILNNKVGLMVMSATAVLAVDNLWVGNKQGTDDDGYFPDHQTIDGPVTVVDGNNYALTTDASLTY